MGFLSDLGSAIADSFDPIGLFHGGDKGADGSSTSLADLWDKFKNGEANDTNKAIADENLEYQRERNEIEDSRYEDETSYNRAFQEEERDYQRAFAEDERAYNRALQERLFAREDTAQLRQAEQLSQLGINPLSQQLNGAGAGQVVGSSGAGSPVGNPSASARGGQALHNDFRAIPGGIEGALSALSGLANTVNGVATGQYQRDSLALENDRQYLENYKLAHSLGIDYGHMTTSKTKRDTSTQKSVWDNENNTLYTHIYTNLGKNPEFNDTSGNYFLQEADKKRQLEGKAQHNIFDWEGDKTRMLKSLGTLDFQNLASNLLTNIANAGNWVNGNLRNFSEDMSNNAIMSFIAKFFAL